ncbi:putative ubiquitin-conjugating enzyme E2 [Triangularia verruculosa]|uniref:E2 ubiquitin-conjugating enzyme n=1 Tax=Triangularia verruculosa TaxID=2587418 RepID=A0AAN6X656_9PEZI|nr:putative ubiquitin-conjugating enzyme E2 [Triangularia verruculosa]
MSSSKRITKELTDCTTTPPPNITITLPSDSNISLWHITLAAPPESIYHPGKFGLIVSFPLEYPFKPPQITFATRIYHPNITNESSGSICLSLLKTDNWKPSTKIVTVLDAIRQLLVEPQPDDPLETRIAEQYKNDRKEFEKEAKAYVNKYAKGPVKFSTTTTDGGSTSTSSTTAPPGEA